MTRPDLIGQFKKNNNFIIQFKKKKITILLLKFRSVFENWEKNKIKKRSIRK